MAKNITSWTIAFNEFTNVEVKNDLSRNSADFFDGRKKPAFAGLSSFLFFRVFFRKGGEPRRDKIVRLAPARDNLVQRGDVDALARQLLL